MSDRDFPRDARPVRVPVRRGRRPGLVPPPTPHPMPPAARPVPGDAGWTVSGMTAALLAASRDSRIFTDVKPLLTQRGIPSEFPGPAMTDAHAVPPVLRALPELPGLARMIEPPEEYEPRRGERAVSLCGGIPGVDPWHDGAAIMLAHEFARRFPGQQLAIICPRRRDVVRAPDGSVTIGGRPWTSAMQARQVGWESAHIRPANGIALFWFPASTLEFPQPTSLWELAWALASGFPVVVGAHEGYSQRNVLVHQLRVARVRLHDSLASTVDAAVGPWVRGDLD